jgi:hypothetical protein
VYFPFRFVFIDGCLSAKGPFHEAFGIIDANYDALGRNYRAYMGWNAKSKNSLLNTSQERWSARFWQAWINPNTNPAYNTDLDVAVLIASQQQSISEQPVIVGFKRLKWTD